MTVSFQGTALCRRVLGRQRNPGSTTTHFGTNGALSRSSKERSAFSAPIVYPKHASSHCSDPTCDRAYGSNSNLWWLNRCPSSGMYGPCTRKPYTDPGRTPGRYPCQTSSVNSGSSIRCNSSLPVSLKRHNSTFVACALNNAKFTPRPSHVAPRGYGEPSRICPGFGIVRSSRRGPESSTTVVSTST